MVVPRIRPLAVLLALALGGSVLGGAAVTPAAGAAANQPTGSMPSAAIPETVTARLDGLPVAYGAASADAAGAPAGDTVSAPAEAPIPFAMVGLELPPEVDAQLRTSVDGRTWGEWTPAPHMEGDDGPDLAAPEGATDVTRHTEPVWVGEARFLQVSLDGGSPSDVDATFIDTVGLSDGSGGTVTAAAAAPEGEAEAPADTGFEAAASRPRIVTRAQWGADETLARTSSSAASVRYAVIHHTAGTNSYSASEGPSVVRGIYQYHLSLGWNDVGYNILVDRYGQIYEGRRGSLDRAVIGAHAQGFNTSSLGISVMGDFSTAAPPQAAIDAVADVLAWKLGTYRVDPLGGVLITSGGSNKYAAGAQVPMATIFGHRDVGLTACPGLPFHSKLPTIRQMVKNRMAATPVGSSSFSDTGGSVHAGNIEILVDKGVTQGCAAGRFCPDGVVTRAQAVTMLVRATGRSGSSARPYSDVPAGHAHAATITAASEAGFVGGYGDGTFRPDAPVTRDQLATMLAKAAGLARQPGQFFDDVPWTSPHLAYVNAIGQAKISTGCGGGSYCPGRTATRAELATLIVAAFY